MLLLVTFRKSFDGYSSVPIQEKCDHPSKQSFYYSPLYWGYDMLLSGLCTSLFPIHDR